MNESYSGQYQDLWRRHWWWRARHQTVLSIVSEALGGKPTSAESPSLLDIGCAGGVAFDDWSQFGEIYGVEPDSQLARGMVRWQGRVENATFQSYNSPRQYDAILMLDVLEHIEDDHAAVEKVHELLKPEGVLILTVPALMWLWSHHDVANHHFRRYHRQELTSLFQRHRFDVKLAHYMFGWSLGLVYLRTLLSRPCTEYRVTVPPAPINEAFYLLSRIEASLTRRLCAPPLGSSILLVATPSR